MKSNKEKWLERNKDNINFLTDGKQPLSYFPLKHYSKKRLLRKEFSDLTPLEMLVYSAYQVNTLREIANILKKSHIYIRKVYKRAYKKRHP